MPQELNLGPITATNAARLAYHDRNNAHNVRRQLPADARWPRQLPIMVHPTDSHASFHVWSSPYSTFQALPRHLPRKTESKQ